MALTFRRSPGGADDAGAFRPLQSAPPSPQDAQAQALRQQAGTILVALFRYLREHAVRQPLLAPAVTALRDAVVQHRTQGTADPLNGARLVLEQIRRARQADPSLPPP